MSGEGSLGDRLQKILLLIRQLSDTYGKSPDNPTVIRTVTVYVQELEVAFEKVIGVIGSEETNAADEDLLRKEGGEGGDGTGNSAERRLEGAGSDDGRFLFCLLQDRMIKDVPHISCIFVPRLSRNGGH